MNIPGHGHLGPQNKRHEDSTDTVTFFISSPLGGGGAFASCGTRPLALSCPSVRPH